MTTDERCVWSTRRALGRALDRVSDSIVRIAEIEALIVRHADVVSLARDILARARLDADDAERELARAASEHSSALAASWRGADDDHDRAVAHCARAPMESR